MIVYLHKKTKVWFYNGNVILWIAGIITTTRWYSWYLLTKNISPTEHLNFCNKQDKYFNYKIKYITLFK